MEQININAIYEELKSSAPKVSPEDAEEQEEQLIAEALRLGLKEAIKGFGIHPLDTYDVLGHVQIGENKYTLTFNNDYDV